MIDIIPDGVLSTTSIAPTKESEVEHDYEDFDNVPIFLKSIGSGHGFMLNEKTIFYRYRRRYLHEDPNKHSYETPLDFMTRFQTRKLLAHKAASKEVANSKSVKDISWVVAQVMEEKNENINDRNNAIMASPQHKSPPNSPLFRPVRSQSHSKRKSRKSAMRRGKEYWGNYKNTDTEAERYDHPDNWILQKKNGINYLENKFTGKIRSTPVYDNLMQEDHRVATGHPVYDGKEIWELLQILEVNDKRKGEKSNGEQVKTMVVK